MNTFAHRMMDFGLWSIAILWLCSFIAEHSRRRSQRRNCRVGSPSHLCLCTDDWKINLPSTVRRQAE